MSWKSWKGGIVGGGSGAEVGAEEERISLFLVGGETGFEARA